MRPRQPYTSAMQALAWGLFGILVFVIILVALRAFAAGQDSAFLTGFVDFLTAEAGLVITIAVLFMIGDIFLTFPLPANVPGPFFNAGASVLLITFIVHIFRFLDSFYAMGIYPQLQALEPLLYPLVFIIVLVAGFIALAFQDRCRDREREETPGGEEEACPSWDDVGEEFRLMWYDLFRKIRRELRGK